MAELRSIRCAKCGNAVDFYEGQGMFKCGSCGALYESTGEGLSNVRMVHAPEERQYSYAGGAHGEPGEAMQPGAYQPGWQQGVYGAPGPYADQYLQAPGIPPYGTYGPTYGYGGRKAVDFLLFRRFITPVFVQVLFWIEVVVFLVAGIFIMTLDFGGWGEGPEGWQVLVGLVLILLGPIFARIWCERLVVHFRSYEELKNINAGIGGERSES